MQAAGGINRLECSSSVQHNRWHSTVQFGAQKVCLMMLVMNERRMHHLVSSKFTIGAGLFCSSKARNRMMLDRACAKPTSVLRLAGSKKGRRHESLSDTHATPRRSHGSA